MADNQFISPGCLFDNVRTVPRFSHESYPVRTVHNARLKATSLQSMQHVEQVDVHEFDGCHELRNFRRLGCEN